MSYVSYGGERFAPSAGDHDNIRERQVQPRTVDVWEYVLGFMDSQAVLAAVELGVFDALAAAPSDLDRVAHATGLSADAVEHLLTPLSALGLVLRQPDGRYALHPAADAQLVRGRPGYIGSFIPYLRDVLYPAWSRLADSLQAHTRAPAAATAHAPPTEPLFSDPKALREFLHGMHTLAYNAARQFAGLAPELHHVRRIVDVGGATGAFLIALAEQHPKLHGVIFDLPPVQPIAEERLASSAVAERIAFVPGSFWDTPVPAGADAYALGFILHDWDDDSCRRILRNIASAAAPGALLIVGEFLLDDDRCGPLYVARQHLNMFVSARGRERTRAEYQALLRSAGFQWQRTYSTSGGKCFMVSTRRAN